MNKFRKIPLQRIKQAALKVASAVRPEKIILFGSYAYGKPTADSDVDFLLIVPEKSQKDRDRIYDKASDALIPRPFSIDFVVRSRSDISWRIKDRDYFLKEIIDNGHVLYEK